MHHMNNIHYWSLYIYYIYYRMPDGHSICDLWPQTGMNDIHSWLLNMVIKMKDIQLQHLLHGFMLKCSLLITNLIAHSNAPMFQHNWELMNMSRLTINMKVMALEENQGEKIPIMMAWWSSGGLNNTNQTKQRLCKIILTLYFCANTASQQFNTQSTCSSF